MKKHVSNFLSYLPILMGFLYLYASMSGLLDKWINSITSPQKNDSALLFEESYKPGSIIYNYKSAYRWQDDSVKPLADIYAPDNKSGKPHLYYGISQSSANWYDKCLKEDIEHNKKHPLDEKHLGVDKYNPDKIVNAGETFERKYMRVKNTVNSIEFIDSLKDCESRYFLSDGRQIAPYLSENHKLENTVIKETSGKVIDNQNLSYIKVQITVESQSEWVQEVCMVPKLLLLEKNDDILSFINTVPYHICYTDENFYAHTGYPIYNDLGYFDTTLPLWYKIDEMHYPMRKGETVTYNLIYVLPEVYLDDAYLVYNDIEHQELFNYNLTDIRIVKLKSGTNK